MASSGTGIMRILIDSRQFNQLNGTLQSIAASAQHQPFWNTQIFAAIIGAALGLIPALYLFWKDRPIIKTKISASFVALSFDRMRTGFSVSIYNHGRRAINLNRIYLKFKDGETLVFLNESNFVGGSGMPRALGENASHSVTILAQEVTDGILRKNNEYPICACYSDALGKEYRAKTSKEFWVDLFKSAEKD